MRIEIPEHLIPRPKGDRIAWDEIRPVVEGPEPDGSDVTARMIRIALLDFRSAYERVREDSGDPVTTATDGFDLVILTDDRALEYNPRKSREYFRKGVRRVTRLNQIDRQNLTPEQREIHSREMAKGGFMVAALRKAARQRPAEAAFVSRVPKLGGLHVVREDSDA